MVTSYLFFSFLFLNGCARELLWVSVFPTGGLGLSLVSVFFFFFFWVNTSGLVYDTGLDVVCVDA